jgi:predicted cupin superfamily sugar epimerase
LVKSDEVWNHHGGASVEQFQFDPGAGQLSRHVIGPVEKGGLPQVVVKGGTWQASRPMGAYAFVGCSVGPGFQYEDFALMREAPELAQVLKRRYPEVAELL